MEGDTGATTREKSHQKTPAGRRHGAGLDEETTNTRDERWHHLQPREGGECLAYYGGPNLRWTLDCARITLETEIRHNINH